MKTQIEKKLKRKTNEYLVDTIIACKKSEPWILVAKKISKPRRIMSDLNLDEIDKMSKDNDTIIIPGKVLGYGSIKKKIKISALSYSESAKKKLRDKKIEFNLIIDQIKSDPDAKGIKILERK